MTEEGWQFQLLQEACKEKGRHIPSLKLILPTLVDHWRSKGLRSA